MRRLLTVIIIGITILFMGCGNSIVKKSIEQAKTLIESKEYDKAILSLEMALDEDKENEEANKLYEIVDAYQKAKKSVHENNFEEAKKILNSINEEYINYSIKDDIDGLKNEVENYYKEIEKVNTNLAEAEKLFNENKYADCKVYLSTNILGSQGDGIEENKYATEEQKQKSLELLDKCEKAIAEEEAKILEEQQKNEQAKGTRDEYIQKLNMIEVGLNDLSYLYESGVTADLVEAEGETLKRWDDMLNEIYSLLKVQLSKTEMDELTDKQISWIEYRDTTAQNEANSFGGGSFAGVQYNSTLARLTKERCYELVNTYMK